MGKAMFEGLGDVVADDAADGGGDSDGRSLDGSVESLWRQKR